MKIDFLIAENQYGTTVHFAKGLSKALNQQGVKTRLFWIGEGHFYHAFYEIMANPPDLTCSFSDISLDGKPLGDLWQIPHLNLLVDPAIYFLHQLKGKYSWVSCVDEKDCLFLRMLDFPRVFFFPHAVDASLKTPPKKERPYECVFFGTCIDYEAVSAKWGKERDLLLTASEKVLTAQEKSILEALSELDVDEKDLARFHLEVDRYTRGKDRIELICSLKNHRVHIWGEGPWKKYLPDCEVHSSATFDKTIEIMKQSRVVLNSSPRFKAGSHERMVYALMCGAALYTGESVFVKKHLPEAWTYRYGEWEVPKFQSWQESAERGQKAVLAKHTWDIRATTLLNLFS